MTYKNFGDGSWLVTQPVASFVTIGLLKIGESRMGLAEMCNTNTLIIITKRDVSVLFSSVAFAINASASPYSVVYHAETCSINALHLFSWLSDALLAFTFFLPVYFATILTTSSSATT